MTGSCSYSQLKEFPGITEKSKAKAFAKKYGFILVFKYKSKPDGQYDNLGTAKFPDQAESFLASPYCHDIKILYDAR